MRSLFSASGVFVVVVLLFSLGYGQNRDDVEEAKLLSVPKVIVPKEALETGLGGSVNVRIVVDESGKVTAVEDVNGPGRVCKSVTRADVVAIRKAAIEAAMKATFSPATREGKPEKSSTWISFDFTAKEQKDDLAFSATSPENETRQFEVAEVNGTADKSRGVLNHKAIALPKPGYPPAARAVRASGPVGIQVLIDEDGTIFSAEAVSGHPLLRSAARIAACGAQFSPTLLSGRPVKVAGIITYNFVP